MKPDFPEDRASVVRSQLKTWMAELEVLSRDPRVRKFAELRQKIEMADAWYRLGSPGQGEIGGEQTGARRPADAKFALQEGRLGGPRLPAPPHKAEGGVARDSEGSVHVTSV